MKFSETTEIFRNQSNIKEITAPQPVLRRIKLKNMQLLSLEVIPVGSDDGIDLHGIIYGQSELKNLKLPKMSQTSNKQQIFTELKSLNHLEMTVNELQQSEFLQFLKLKKLDKVDTACLKKKETKRRSYISRTNRSISMTETLKCQKYPQILVQEVT
jgi:hypothetical protein